MKHIKKFQHAEEYNNLHEDGGMIDVCPTVSYIEELQTVRFEPRGGAGTIVMANEEGDKRFLTIDEYRGSVIKNMCDEEGYQAIGVIVVPASHTENGKARMMALHSLGEYKWEVMNNGTIREYEYFSAIATNTMGKDGDFPRVQKEIDRDYVSMYNNCYAPSDAIKLLDSTFSKHHNPYDTQTQWLGFDDVYAGDDEPVLPSPYLNDGSKNPIFHNEYVVYDGEKVYNALADLDGKGNTEKFLKIHTGDELLTACSQYSTDPNNVGEWYVPSIGELCYLFARSRRINAALKELSAIGGVIDDVTKYNIWTSTLTYGDGHVIISPYDYKISDEILYTSLDDGHLLPFLEVEM